MDAVSPPTPDDLSSPQALLQSFLMIIISELGDKTFLIAAILAMRHPRLTVFLGAFLSLLLMSFLSASLGHLLPTLIPRRWTQWCAAALFLVFGVKMLGEARGMAEGGKGKMEEEMREAEEEIEDDERVHEGGLLSAGIAPSSATGNAIPLHSMEEGRKSDDIDMDIDSTSSSTKKPKPSWTDGARNFCSLFLGPVFVQAFVLTFLGEWGDRSQIATIALGAAHNVYVVTFGTVLGHACCTALAVVGGRYVSTKISVKHGAFFSHFHSLCPAFLPFPRKLAANSNANTQTVTYGGSALFLLFGLIYLYEGFVTSASESLNVGMGIPIPVDVDDGGVGAGVGTR
ncbi:hypothetical protein CVT25_008776 [Psilocybe cyanescens]|uniref:GDT1 family protein n=1 Tax=Psilocybe cyanescens TaxID=93625 RepID=A0A409XN39_PSICY|nr:hypothetical protein CVT25_008776 [Psilocybe cyanescens]